MCTSASECARQVSCPSTRTPMHSRTVQLGQSGGGNAVASGFDIRLVYASPLWVYRTGEPSKAPCPASQRRKVPGGSRTLCLGRHRCCRGWRYICPWSCRITIRSDQGRLRWPPQAARTVGPLRTRTGRSINRAKRTARPVRSTPPEGGQSAAGFAADWPHEGALTSTAALGHRRQGYAPSARRQRRRVARQLQPISGRRPSPPAPGRRRVTGRSGRCGWPGRPGGARRAAAVAGALVGALSALGAADDRPGAGGRPAGAALAVQLDHDLGPQGGVLLLPAHPGGQLPDRAFPGREQAAVEGHERRVQLRCGRGGGGAWGEAEAVALPGGPQRPVRDAEFLAGLVDADLGGALPGLLGGVAVLVEAGASGPALEPLGLGQAVLVEGAPQGLLGWCLEPPRRGTAATKLARRTELGSCRGVRR